MFMAADIVVKAVMVSLAFASVLTWTIWFAKAIELMFARRQMRTAIEKLAHAFFEPRKLLYSQQFDVRSAGADRTFETFPLNLGSDPAQFLHIYD